MPRTDEVVARMPVLDFDHIVEEHKQRRLADVAQAEQMRLSAERGRDEANAELAALTSELSSVKAQLSKFKAELSQRESDWTASVSRIQQTLEARETTILERERGLDGREQSVNASSDRCRHQWTLIHEASDQVKAIARQTIKETEEGLTKFLNAMPSGTDRPVAPETTRPHPIPVTR